MLVLLLSSTSWQLLDSDGILQCTNVPTDTVSYHILVGAWCVSVCEFVHMCVRLCVSLCICVRVCVCMFVDSIFGSTLYMNIQALI